MPEPKVFIFWDNSNIFISAKDVADRRGEAFDRYDIRIHFDALYHLAHADRHVGGALAVGSVPPELRQVWDRLRASGVNVQLYERGAQSHKEQAVDEVLQVDMLRQVIDNDDPQIAVLLTGDGAGYDSGAGFHADLERMHKKGWGIEVIAWEESCNRKLRKWAEDVGFFIRLEDYYESVTFVEQGRHATPLSLTHRPTATPAGYDPAKERRKEKARQRSQQASKPNQKQKKKRK